MSLILHTSNRRFEEVIKKEFNFLRDLFKFDPNTVSPYSIEFTIVDSPEEFLKIYETERGGKPEDYVVGFTGNNGRIFVLNESLFETKGHSKDEFVSVIAHELCHIFVRRLLDPKNTLMWINEGICEYLAFKNNSFIVNNPIDFRKLETREDWRKFHAYQQSGAFFKFLSDNYGIKKVIEFVKSIKNKGEYESFNEFFGDFEKTQGKFFKSLGK